MVLIEPEVQVSAAVELESRGGNQQLCGCEKNRVPSYYLLNLSLHKAQNMFFALQKQFIPFSYKSFS